MPIELFFSNLSETLAEKLDEVFRLERRTMADIFRPSLVIVPNANLKKWLQPRLAKSAGIAMNIDFQYLEQGLWGLLESLDPEAEKPSALDLPLRRLTLLHALEHLDRDDPVFGPVLDYLTGPGGTAWPDHEKRLWQLADKLATLFQEYEFHRSETVQNWLDESYETSDDMERCQRALYLADRRARQGLSGDFGASSLSLMEYTEKVFSRMAENGAPAGDGERFVHVFGFSSVSTFHLDLIKRLGGFFTFVIYSINPCREFWEDVKTPWEKKWIKSKSWGALRLTEDEKTEGELFSEAPNPLLSLWGKPGRESVRMLCELTDYDFNAFYKPPPRDGTVLHEMQNRVLTYHEPSGDAEKTEQDVSFQIVACPGRHREVETVYNSILHNLEKDKNLHMTDIAVQVPDISAYKPAIDAVFNRKPRAVSYNLADARAEIESLFGKAVRCLLELATGRFARREVFELLLNPCVMHKWDMSPDDVRIFAGWADSLNIFHSYDLKSKASRGYPPSALYTWKQGLTRMKLSRVLSDPTESAAGRDRPLDSPFFHFRGVVPYSDADSADPELLEKFCLLIEKLHQVVGILDRGPRPAEQWKRTFLFACDELFEIPPDMRAEKSVRAALFESLERLPLYGRLGGGDPGDGIELALFKEFVKAGLGDIQGGYGEYLAGGVTISALIPMRPIPFEIIYVLGMEEGAFPGKPETSSLDLRRKRRKLGDVNVPERNCYLFLELLLSARRKLYVSYVSRDLRKDREQQPCSVLNQLKRYVESEILPAGAEFRTARVPLKPSDPGYIATDAVNDFSDVMVNYSVADRIAHYRENGLWSGVSARMTEEERRVVEPFVPDFAFKPSEEGEIERPVEKIAARQLRGFLEDPVKQSIRRHMLLYDEDDSVEDIAAVEDEPFYGRFPADYRLVMEPLGIWIDRVFSGAPETDWDDLLTGTCREVHADFQMRGMTPEGVYGELDLDALLESVFQRAEILRPVLKKAAAAKGGAYHALYIGEADSARPPAVDARVLRMPPLSMEIEAPDARNNMVRRPVRIHGTVPWLWKGADGLAHCLALGYGKGRKEKKREIPGKYLLDPLLSFFLALCQKERPGVFADGPAIFHEVCKDNLRSWTCDLDAVQAAGYIRRLTSLYLAPSLRDWLPFAQVVKAVGKMEDLYETPAPDDAGPKFEADLLQALNDLDDPLVLLAGPEIPAGALESARERFGLFFKNLSAKGSPA